MNEAIISTVEKLIADLLAGNPADFLVSIRIKPVNNIKLYLDSEGPEGMSIEKCVKYNRALYKQIEESGLFPDGNFSLEVSSPGISEPLKLHRQYLKNKGRFVEVVFKDETIKEGKLLEVTDSDILLEQITGKGKKAVTNQFLIPFDNIKTTTVQIQF